MGAAPGEREAFGALLRRRLQVVALSQELLAERAGPADSAAAGHGDVAGHGAGPGGRGARRLRPRRPPPACFGRFARYTCGILRFSAGCTYTDAPPRITTGSAKWLHRPRIGTHCSARAAAR
jgi:hypothetical protein